jgi:hypothetical protein
MKSRPLDVEYAGYFSRYVSLVPETDVMAVLEEQPVELTHMAALVAADRERFRYDIDKWSIREVFGHLSDAERVFGYRAFCISRGEQAFLPAFDENAYVARSHYDEQTLADLLAELIAVRRANIAFLRHLGDREWERTGTASNKPVSVRALAFVMAGHVRHHSALLSKNYGVVPRA